MSSLVVCVFLHCLWYFCKSQTIVATNWTDDFTGWSNTNIYNDNCCPCASQYHGVYKVLGITTFGQTFKCDNGIANQRYLVSIKYGFAYDPCGDKNTINVEINSQNVATHKRLDGTGYYNTDQCYSNIACSGTGNKASIQERSVSPPSLNDITSNDPFVLTFEINAASAGYELAIFGIEVTCYAKSFSPTTNPTIPTYIPTNIPTTNPTYIPTKYPSTIPTSVPSYHPTTDPTTDPTKDPTKDPTTNPSYHPTTDPTFIPTSLPTTDPIWDPTFIPTNVPTVNPTQKETTMASTNGGLVLDTVWTTYPMEIYYIMIVIIILLLTCSILLCCIFYKKRKQHKIRQKALIELGKVSTTTMNTIASTSMVVNAEPDVYSDHVALQMWLKNIDCMEYYDIFIEHGFGDQMHTLSMLTESDLQSIGIDKMAVRKRILLQIQHMNVAHSNMMNASAVNMGLMSDGPPEQVVNDTMNEYDMNTTMYIENDDEESEYYCEDEEANELYLSGKQETRTTKGNDTPVGKCDGSLMDDEGSTDNGTDDDMFVVQSPNQTNQ